LRAPSLKNNGDLVMIFLGDEFVETRRHFLQNGVETAFDAVFRVKLQLLRQRNLFFLTERKKGWARKARGQKRYGGSLTVLKEFSAAQKGGLRNFPGPAQTMLLRLLCGNRSVALRSGSVKFWAIRVSTQFRGQNRPAHGQPERCRDAYERWRAADAFRFREAFHAFVRLTM